MRKTTSLALLALLLTALPALSQSLGALRDIEERLLQRRIDEYERAYRAEREAAAKLDQVVRRLSQSLGEPSVTVSQLRDIEAEVSLARETALLRARESTDLRRDIYARMERLEELERELARGGGSLRGRWRLDLGQGEGTGIVTFYSYSGRVEGFYEMANGRSGSLRGTLRGDRLELERVDSETGLDRSFHGRLLEGGRVIDGEWQDRELANGRAAAGVWRAERIGEPRG